MAPRHQQLCADGIDELLTKFIGGPPEWGHVEYGVGTIELRTIGRNWFIRRETYSRTTPSGKIIDKDWVYNPADPVSEPDTIVIGNAQAINLWLSRRVLAANLAVTGDTSAADQLRSNTAEATR